MIQPHDIQRASANPIPLAKDTKYDVQKTVNVQFHKMHSAMERVLHL